MIWYKNNNSDIVVSTRIRLARNVDKTPFPNALKDTKEVTEKIKNAVLGGNSTLAKDFDFIDLDNTPLIRKQELAEEHLISPVMCEGKGKQRPDNEHYAYGGGPYQTANHKRRLCT